MIACPIPSNVPRATHHPPSRIAPSTSSGARPMIDRMSSTRTARRSATRRAGTSVRDARALASRRGVGDGPARRGGAVSRTTPPAIVRRRPDSRRTNRSPTSRTSGQDSVILTNAPSAGTCFTSYRRIRASRSAAPACSLNAPRDVIGRSSDRTGSMRASRTDVAVHRPAGARTSPRAIRARSAVRLAATRETGDALPTSRWCVWSPRTLARVPDGRSSTSAPVVSGPPVSVPVTTVPEPLIENTRSTCRRGRPSRSGSGAPASIASSATTSSSNPSPVADEHATIGAPSSPVPWTRSVTSARARSSRARSTRSRLVSAITAPCAPRTSTISRCSSDCGFQPSSAATTNSTRRTGPTPASIVRTNRSCPGTSTNPSSRPEGSVHHAYPSSIVRPRRFSSSRRSGSIPVRRMTRLDLP